MYRTLQTTLLSLLLLANSAALALDSSNEVALATTPLPPLPIWTNLLVITANEALAELPIAWSDRGTPLRLTAADGSQALTCHLRQRRSSIEWQTPPRCDHPFEASIVATMMLPNTNAVALLEVRRSRQRCHLYVDGQPALSFADIWDGDLVVATAAATHHETEEESFVQRLGPFLFEDDFLIDKEAPEALQLWSQLSGTWGLHAVTGTTVRATDDRKLKRYPTPERSPNFYSLIGEGSRAMIVAGEPCYGHYRYRASVQHNTGTNGLLFLMRDEGPTGGHAFTVQTNPDNNRLIFALWRGTDPATGLGRLVEAVQTDLLPGQWLMLEVQLFDDHLACFVDQIEVIRRRLALPPGGMFGLYSDAPGGTRFDDVHAATHDEIVVLNSASFTPWLRHTSGALESVAGLPQGVSSSDDPFAVTEHWLKRSATNRSSRIIGATNDTPRRITTTIVPDSPRWQADLIVGWQGSSRPHYRLTTTRRTDVLAVALQQWSPDGTITTLDTTTLPLPATGGVELSLDATGGYELVGRIAGRAVVWSPIATPASGAAGLELGTTTRAALTLPQLSGATPRLTDRFEKNNIYVTDPFMRHWASPEGQWLEYPDEQLAWYKSDVLRQVELHVPAVDATTLHLLVPEGSTNGWLQVGVTNNQLYLTQQLTTCSNLTQQLPLQLFPATQPKADGPKYHFYTARLLDSIFTIGCETGLLARCRLPDPLPGRRMFLQGMKTAELGVTRVEREPVLDCLFTESLHDWNIGSGSWEVINRFQCYPDWSHMNGESSDSLATLWSKYRVSGDFSLELFAGMRHGWYNRVGDLNLTVMNSSESTGSGYTLTTAGWDPDESQLWSRLFRNGQLMARSDLYTTPRIRAGNQRRGYEPLVQAGRDVHGAWYTLRLRRVADRLTFDFDNQRILDVTDPEPLASGNFGIWTYRNSMMVARVRVTADKIEPRRFAFSPLRYLPPPPATPAADAPAHNLTVNGWPLQLLQPSLWYTDDAAGHTRLTFRHTTTKPELVVHSAQGGGSFLAHADLPDIPAASLLGWRFEVARHPEARFNLEYLLGEGSGEKFTPIEALSFGICGSDEERGPRRLTGRLSRPPAATPEAATEPVWSSVTAWLPVEAASGNLQVRLEGFGNLQPSDIQQGLLGNPPGAWYAIRNLSPIYHNAPEFANQGELDLQPLLSKIKSAPAARLNSLEVPPEIDPTRPQLLWGVSPGSELALLARPAQRPPHSLRVVSTLPWPNRLLTNRNVKLNDQPVAITWLDHNELVVPLPRTDFTTNDSLRLSLDLSDGRTFTQMLPVSQLLAEFDKRPTPPLLISLDLTNFPACYQSFESRAVNPEEFKAAALPYIRFDDPRQGSYLRFANNGKPGRLHGLLARNYDLARWPLLQFRYRGDPMAAISLRAGNHGFISFTEEHPQATAVLQAPKARVDHVWHTWIGELASHTYSRPVTAGYRLEPSPIHLGSFHSVDQTGRYSTFDIDDLAAGPVLPTGQPLLFRANYYATAPLSNLQYSVVSGATPWEQRPAAEREAATWHATGNNTWTEFATDALADGIHHLILRAWTSTGQQSLPSDLPFMIDRSPALITSQVAPTDRLNGTLLRLNFDGQGAPPLMETLQLTCDGQPFNFSRDSTSLVHFSTNGITLDLNWPLLLREEIQKSSNGKLFSFRCEGLRDAAGNSSLPHQTAVKVDYASDKEPPTWPDPVAPTNAFWWAPKLPTPNALFTINRGLNVGHERVDQASHVTLKAAGKGGMVGRIYNNPNWVIDNHRYLALSLRLAPATKPSTNEVIAEIRFRPAKLPRGVRAEREGSFFLPLTRKTAANQTTLFGNLKWEAGHWNDLIIDVAAFLQQASGSNEPFELREFNIVLPPASDLLHVRAAAIMAPWAATDLFTFRAYDASGIAGLFWQGNGQAPHTAIRPAFVKLPADDPVWMKITIRDRAGNNSLPFLLPLPPQPAPTINLPLSEPWQ